MPQIKKLQQQIRQMEQLECKKACFYAEIGHDLRQPLQALKLFVGLLKDEKVNSYQSDLISKIDNSTACLEVWLENLIEMGRLNSGHLKLREIMIDLSGMLTRLALEYQALAKYNGKELSYQGKKIKIKADAVLLERIIRNLLQNALKYSRGKINLYWYELPQTVKIIIKDNGLGLKKEECQKLFEAFYQCPRDRGNGYGLGLAIVKELTDKLNIKLTLKSKWRKGTIFVLSLPKIKNKIKQ